MHNHVMPQYVKPKNGQPVSLSNYPFLQLQIALAQRAVKLAVTQIEEVEIAFEKAGFQAPDYVGVSASAIDHIGESFVEQAMKFKGKGKKIRYGK